MRVDDTTAAKSAVALLSDSQLMNGTFFQSLRLYRIMAAGRPGVPFSCEIEMIWGQFDWEKTDE
jgi:hypothetical protein